MVLEGVSYREAATQAGLRSTADLRRYARTFGVRETHTHVAAQRKAYTEEIETPALIAGLKRLANLASHELGRRLEIKPSEIQTRDPTVLAGVAVDKIRDFEDWRAGNDPGASNVAVRALDYLFEACKAHGPIEVTVEGLPRAAPTEAPRQAAPPMRGDQIREEVPWTAPVRPHWQHCRARPYAASSSSSSARRPQATMLLCGDTGTGKELLARAVHQGSPRRAHGLIAVNCAAFPDAPPRERALRAPARRLHEWHHIGTRSVMLVLAA